MALQFRLFEFVSPLGKNKGKTVLQARPTARKKISHRNFCEGVARGTTFTAVEIEAALRLAAEYAKKEVENGNIVDLGDLGSLKPSFKSMQVRKDSESFNVLKHIIKPTVKLLPSKQYFELQNVSYERVEQKKK